MNKEARKAHYSTAATVLGIVVLFASFALVGFGRKFLLYVDVILAVAGITVGVRLCLARMSKVATCLLLLAGILPLYVSSLGTVGLWIFGGRLKMVGDVIFIIYPLLAFPIFCFVAVSLRVAVVAFWAYVAFDYVFPPLYFASRHGSVHLRLYPGSGMQRMLLVAAILMQTAFYLQKRSQRNTSTPLP